MKKRLIFTLFLAAFVVMCFAQKPYKVMFYNLENFFDTINDPEVHDDEFTPEGPKKWNSAKYYKKLGNIERVLFDVAAADKNYPAVIGVSEVETRSVLEDIVRHPNWPPATTVSCITIRPKPAVSMWPSCIVPMCSSWRAVSR